MTNDDTAQSDPRNYDLLSSYVTSGINAENWQRPYWDDLLTPMPRPPQHPTNQGPLLPPANFTVLVTDDDADNLSLMGLLLLRSGFNAIMTNSSAETLNYCREQPISLVTTDLMRPDMNGFELIYALRNAGFSAPILVISSAIGNPSRANAALQSGATDWLVKPVSPIDILRKIALLIPVDPTHLGMLNNSNYQSSQL